MTELISAVESAVQWTQLQNSWAMSAKRLQAFTVIVGGGSVVVFLVVFFHSPEWRIIREIIIFPLLLIITVIGCIGALTAILLFHLRQSDHPDHTRGDS